jgi:hypothetical protein
MRYFFAWTPLVIVAAVVLLALPWLGLIALVLVSLLALATLVALACAVVAVPYALGRDLGRRWQDSRGARPHTAVLSPASSRAGRRRTPPVGAAVLLASAPPERDRT